MITLIPVGGKGTRYDCNIPKCLSKLNGSTILDRLLRNSLPNPTLLVRQDNKAYFDTYSDKADIFVAEGDYIGCLFDIFRFIRSITPDSDDLLIICGDIVFDFNINEFIQNLNDLITIPILPREEREDVSDSGAVTINNKGIVTNFIEHINTPGEYRELGIYFIPKRYLKYITGCCFNYKVGSPGYFIEYIHTFFPVKTQVMTGNWFHINTIEDYQCCLERLHGS